MTRFEKILESCPLLSYEEDRKRNGNMQLAEESEQRILCPGVTYRKRRYQRGNGADVWVYLAEVSPNAKAQLAVSACPLRTIKPVKEHARDFDGDVLLAMNAGFFHFFNNGDLTPYGIQVMHGVTMSEPGRPPLQHSHFFVGVKRDGTPVISNTDEYEEGLKHQLEYAVGGGVQLIRNGQIFLHEPEMLAPRTAVAIAADGTAILLCADGRSRKSAGLSYADIIDIYLQSGYEIRDLLNLDGGGSTAMVLKEADGGFVVQNVPSGPPTPEAPAVEPHGEEQARPVADALLIIARP